MAQLDTHREDIDRAASYLRWGGIVAFPTETYYGLAVDPFNEAALAKLFQAKGRPAVKPVLVLIDDRDQIPLLASEIPSSASRLMDTFWPGPLTLVLPAQPTLSPLLTGGTGTVGIRLSPHPLAAELLRIFDGPLTATSANRSGFPPAITADQVYASFGAMIDVVIDGGRTPGEKASTLVGFKDNRVVCIREGCIGFTEILNVPGIISA